MVCTTHKTHRSYHMPFIFTYRLSAYVFDTTVILAATHRNLKSFGLLVNIPNYHKHGRPMSPRLLDTYSKLGATTI